MYKMICLVLLLGTANLKAQTIRALNATDFEKEIKAQPKAFLIDVRTANEFSNGHILNATNSDWKNGNFKTQISKVDKSKPVLIYCLSGGRSDLAAKYLAEQGFKNITVLEGGLMKWRAEKLAETAQKNIKAGLSYNKYNALIKSDKLVLVDFYADWCIPCQQMKPFIDKIARLKKHILEVVRLNTEDNGEIVKALNITALPVLKLYKNGEVVFNHEGFMDEESLLKLVEKYK